MAHRSSRVFPRRLRSARERELLFGKVSMDYFVFAVTATH
jgi:hypothetical protein